MRIYNYNSFHLWGESEEDRRIIMINDTTICRASFAAGETRSNISCSCDEAKEVSGGGRGGIIRTRRTTTTRKELVRFNELEVAKNFALGESCAKYATISSPSKENRPERGQHFKQVLIKLKSVNSSFEQPLRGRRKNKIARHDCVDSLNLAYISLLFLPILAVKCLPGK